MTGRYSINGHWNAARGSSGAVPSLSSRAEGAGRDETGRDGTGQDGRARQRALKMHEAARGEDKRTGVRPRNAKARPLARGEWRRIGGAGEEEKQKPTLRMIMPHRLVSALKALRLAVAVEIIFIDAARPRCSICSPGTLAECAAPISRKKLLGDCTC